VCHVERGRAIEDERDRAQEALANVGVVVLLEDHVLTDLRARTYASAREPAPAFRRSWVGESLPGDITTTEEARRAGAGAFLNKTDLPHAPLARLVGGE
jgi:hypothetical protein